jgi:uncharacterized protein (TIGR02302 family)
VSDLETTMARKQALAWLALFWERLWPALWPAAAIVAVYVAISLMDLPAALGGWLHLVLIAIAALALAQALWRGLTGFRRPSAEEARRRLEIESRMPHRPLATLQDRLSPTADAGTRRLWEEHVARSRRLARRIRAGWPRPGLAARDAYAFRAGVFLLLVIGLSVAGGDGLNRLARGLMPDFSSPPPVPAHLDAWINPPPYTDLPPFQLHATEQNIRVPAGSRLLARVYGGRGRPVLQLGSTTKPFDSVDRLNHELEFVVQSGDRLVVTQEGRTLGEWPLEVVPDKAPEITLAKAPTVTERGALRLDFTAKDDYGLTSAKAEFRLDEGDSGDVLERPLPLASIGVRETTDVSFQDLTAHPWAGLRVVLKLTATDALGQVGESQELPLVLPERQFHHPVARALIEQRKLLVREPDRRLVVARALRIIGADPESYGNDVVVILAIASAAKRLQLDRSDTAVPAVVDLLWDTALRIEDGRLSLAERELRDIQQQLMDALARNADNSEIEQLMDRLQEAMQRYLQAMAEQAIRQMQEGQKPAPFNPDAKKIESQQLQEMLNRARELSRMGAKDAAREMLRQLQQMLENLRAGPMMAMPEQLQGADKAIRDLSDLMRDQQKLLDRTFRETQRARDRGLPQRGGQGEQGHDPTQGMDGMQGMSDEQEAMRRRLGEIMRQLGDQFGNIPGALGRAERAMRDAREALGQGEPAPAADAQGHAIDQMAEGMRGLAREMARQMGQGQGNDTEGSPFDEDPLGRPAARGGMDTSTVQIPTKADLQRAREILDELRRRAGESFRPEGERHYIDRLLERF